MTLFETVDDYLSRGYSLEFATQDLALRDAMNARLKERAERTKHLRNGKRYTLKIRDDCPANDKGEIYEGEWNVEGGCYHVEFGAGDSKGGRKFFTIGIPECHVDVIGETP